MTATVVPLRRVTVGDEQAHAQWLRELDDHVRVVVEQVAPTAARWVTCYRLASTDGHYTLAKFVEHPDGSVSVSVQHMTGPGSRLVEGAMGIGVFGVEPAEIVVCGCGQR